MSGEETKSLQKIEPQSMQEFDGTYTQLVEFTRDQLKPDVDFGVISGTTKKTLYKAGAEKIAFLFGLKPELELIKEVENFDDGFFFYRYKCKLVHYNSGKFVGEAVRSCNSMEKKYAFTTVGEKFATEEQKAKSVERFQNSRGYWTLKVPKTKYEVADQANTIDAMAQKRAIVAAVVQATMATEIFDIGEDEGEKEGDHQAPNAPTNQVDDPRRTQITRKYYATCSERGIEGDKANEYAEKMFKVDSFKKLSINQIQKITDAIITHFEVVGKGNPPKKIEKTPIDEAIEEKSDGAVGEKGADTYVQGQTSPEPYVEGEIVEENYVCEECSKDVSEFTANNSKKKFDGKVICMQCQIKLRDK